MKFIDLTGKKIGRLNVISLNSKGKRTYWNCICECGKKKVVDGQHLRSKKTISCGCYSIERFSNFNKTHSKSNTRLYRIWSGIKNRCYNKKSFSYKNYGYRGIDVCKEWKENFMNFYNWSMENGYKENLTIDRIDNNKGYNPNNCRWVDNYTQSNNTRKTIIIEIENKKYSAKQFCTLLNINYQKFLYGFHKFKNINKSIEYAKKHKKRRKNE